MHESYEITETDIRRMHIENQRDLEGCRKVTEGLNDFADIIDKIRTTTEFSKEALEHITRPVYYGELPSE